jgi:ubiquinone/menaquinone biosynthesis C-methylase UbiE
MRARLEKRGAFPVRAEGHALPFPTAAFEGAWAAFVLHHMLPGEQSAVLREVGRVLKLGGTFVLIEDTPETADEAGLTLRADRRLNFEGASSPHHYRSPADWRHELQHQGFTISDEIAFAGLFPRATREAVRHRAFVCRR